MESNSTTDLPMANGEKKQVRLIDVPLNNQQDALQLIVTFLNLAQSQQSCGNVSRCFKDKSY